MRRAKIPISLVLVLAARVVGIGFPLRLRVASMTRTAAGFKKWMGSASDIRFCQWASIVPRWRQPRGRGGLADIAPGTAAGSDWGPSDVDWMSAKPWRTWRA